MNFSPLPFLRDCHVLDVPGYFLREILGWTKSQLLGGNRSLVVSHTLDFSLLARLQATPRKAQGFVIPRRPPTVVLGTQQVLNAY